MLHYEALQQLALERAERRRKEAFVERLALDARGRRHRRGRRTTPAGWARSRLSDSPARR